MIRRLPDAGHRGTFEVPVSVTAVLVLATALVGCNEKALDGAKGTADGGKHAVTASLTPEQAQKVLAKVGDKTITLGDYTAALEHMDQFDRLRYQSPERRKELLQEMINIELLAAEATAKGYDKDPLAEQERRAILREAMLTEAHKGLPGPSDLPEADVRAYYEAHKADYRDPERRRLSLVVTKDEATANEVVAKAKLVKSAAEWGELVRKYSVDPQAKANVPVDLAGDFGFVGPVGDSRGDNPRVPAEVRAAAYEIGKSGDVLLRAVKGGDKFHVVRLSQVSEARERTFGESERTIRIKLAQEKAQNKERDLLQELRGQFPVQIDEAALANVKVESAPK
ncbi:MAG: peptidyl-prolyl cis-trans isomerase [Polyangiaceae bacterium]